MMYMDEIKKARPSKKIRKAKVIAICAVIAVIAIAAGTFAILLSNANEQKIRGNAVTGEEVLKSFQIVSLTYRYTNVIYEADVKMVSKVKLPFTQTYLGVQYDGVIKIGVDGEKIKVTQTDDELRIKLPPAEIISHVQVQGSTILLFDIKSAFNKNTIEDYIDLFESKVHEMEQKAMENGLFEEALDSAQIQLRQFLEKFDALKGKEIIFT